MPLISQSKLRCPCAAGNQHKYPEGTAGSILCSSKVCTTSLEPVLNRGRNSIPLSNCNYTTHESLFIGKHSLL